MDDLTWVHAAILAAGASRRMGYPKALIRIEGETFLARIARLLSAAGIASRATVLGAEVDRVRREAAALGLTVIENERWAEGMLSSIRAAARAAPSEADALLIWPVDHPAVRPDTVSGILRRARDARDRIVVPFFERRRGHPALFPRSLWEELDAVPPGHGANHLLHTHPERVLHVVVDDPGIFLNLNRPEDLDALTRIP